MSRMLGCLLRSKSWYVTSSLGSLPSPSLFYSREFVDLMSVLEARSGHTNYYILWCPAEFPPWQETLSGSTRKPREAAGCGHVASDVNIDPVIRPWVIPWATDICPLWPLVPLTKTNENCFISNHSGGYLKCSPQLLHNSLMLGAIQWSADSPWLTSKHKQVDQIE